MKKENNKKLNTDEIISSIENLSKEDIAVKEEKKVLTKAQKRNRLIYYFVLLLCIATMVVCSALLARNLIDKRRGSDIYDSIADDFFSDSALTSPSSSENKNGGLAFLSLSEPDSSMMSVADKIALIEAGESSSGANMQLDTMRANLKSLITMNPDVYGFIYVEGTNIKYPLVQSSDNSYYLNHAVTKEYLIIGSIFVDFRCEKNITDNYNTVIYGHNMTDGTMFNSIQKFKNADLFNSSKIYIYTLEGIFIYEPFAFYETTKNFDYIRTYFAGKNDFYEWLSLMKSQSKFEKDVSLTSNDKILTLSTCTNVHKDGRFALQAKLVQTITK